MDWVQGLPFLAPIIGTILAAFISSVGISRSARLRKDIAELSAALVSLPEGSTGRTSLQRAVDIGAATFLARRLVSHVGDFAYLVVGVSIGIGIAVFAIGNVWVTAIGSILVVLSYIGLAASTYQANKYRRRQARAILAGRPSGYFKIRFWIAGRGVIHERVSPPRKARPQS